MSSLTSQNPHLSGSDLMDDVTMQIRIFHPICSKIISLNFTPLISYSHHYRDDGLMDEFSVRIMTFHDILTKNIFEIDHHPSLHPHWIVVGSSTLLWISEHFRQLLAKEHF